MGTKLKGCDKMGKKKAGKRSKRKGAAKGGSGPKIIKGTELVRKTRVPYDPSFKSGRYMTEKDRPRKKIKPKDVIE